MVLLFGEGGLLFGYNPRAHTCCVSRVDKGKDKRKYSKERLGHTVLGCLIGRMPCYNEGRCRVSLVCVFSRVWKFSQIQGRQAVYGLQKKGSPPYRFRCSNRLKCRPHDGMGHECAFWG
jgi:hypothetical protein